MMSLISVPAGSSSAAEALTVGSGITSGAGVGAGPFHSQTNEAWFTKTPGLKVVYPAFPADAKGPK